MSDYERVMDQIAAMPRATCILARFPSMATALKAMKRMSFATVDAHGIAFPSHIRCGVFKSAGGAMAVIGGSLAEEEFAEIHHLVKKYGSIDRMAGNQALIEMFSKAALKGTHKRHGRKKKWWQFWKTEQVESPSSSPTSVDKERGQGARAVAAESQRLDLLRLQREPGERDIVKAGAMADNGIRFSHDASLNAVAYNPGTILAIQPHLEAAIRARPENPEYKYLLACAKIAGGLGKIGFDDVRAIAEEHPDFAEAAGYSANPDKWLCPFSYPPWSVNMTEIPTSLLPIGEPACLVKSVRDGCRRVVSFFRRLPQQKLGPNFNPSLPTAIRLAFMETPFGAVVGVALIDTHPTEPYTSETVLNVESCPADATDMSASGFWLIRLLAQQRYTFIVLAEPSGSIYFNRKLAFDSKTKSNLKEVAEQVTSLKPNAIADVAQFKMARKHFMDRFSVEEIRF